jgi:hypothetical protein
MANLQNIPDKDIHNFLATNGGGDFGDMVDSKVRNKIADGVADLKMGFILFGAILGGAGILLLFACVGANSVVGIGLIPLFIWAWHRWNNAT